MSDIDRIITNRDFIGGLSGAPIREKDQTGLGVAIWTCRRCDKKHLTISTISDGLRHSVTIEGEVAAEFASTIMKGLANA